MELLRVENLDFQYDAARGGSALHGISFSVQAGEFLTLQGRSGSGKSTLFYLLGGFLPPAGGKIYFEGRDLSTFSQDQLAQFRNQRLGFVFQQFHLLPKASVLDNILLPQLYSPADTRDLTAAREKALELAKLVGLEAKLDKPPNQLSGGEQQRVAIARALWGEPSLILADEPTGNLDSQNAEVVLTLLKRLNQMGKTIVLITHDPEVARQASRTLQMKDGRLVEASPLPTKPKSDAPAVTLEKRTLWKEVRRSLPLALRNLHRQRVRATLTLLGVSVGVASVLSMLTFGKFAREKILKGYEDLGVSTAIIRGHPNWRRRATDRVATVFRAFDLKSDLAALPRIFPDVEKLTPLYSRWINAVNYGGQSSPDEVLALGVSPEYLPIMNRKLSEGKGISPYHVEFRSPVCMVGSDIKRVLFAGRSPIGEIAFLTDDNNAFPCKIVGVMEPQSSTKDWHKPNWNVVLPHSYFRSVSSYWHSDLHQFAAKVAERADLERVGKGIKAYFQQKYGASGEFFIDNDALLLAQMKRFLSLFSLLLTSIAMVTLAVGGVGIHNMMMVSLSERFKEIGLRKALGATNRNIRVQFLLEASLLAFLAGAIGLLVGFATYEAIIYGASKVVKQLEFEWILDPFAILFSTASILVVGISSGIIPALKAERLSVIEALRNE